MGIRMNPPEFPEHRRQDPKRSAEARVFDALQNLELGGHGLYEFRYRQGGMQVDYGSVGRLPRPLRRLCEGRAAHAGPYRTVVPAHRLRAPLSRYRRP